MEVILYSTGCPLCNVLKMKLDGASIKYQTVSDVNEIAEKGFMSVPVLEIDGETKQFSEAVKWINGVNNSASSN